MALNIMTNLSFEFKIIGMIMKSNKPLFSGNEGFITNWAISIFHEKTMVSFIFSSRDLQLEKSGLIQGSLICL
jgi:hypothetical protein